MATTPLALPPRAAKPRDVGITSMIDFGPDTFGWTGGADAIRNVMECAAAYVDYAKIYALNSLLLPEQTVIRAAKAYRDADVLPFAGGILFEYAWQRNELDDLVRLLKRLSIGGLEISENYVSLSDEERKREIARFQNAGIRIVYEFGRKNPTEPMSFDFVGRLIDDCAALGIDHITVEQCEIDLIAAGGKDGLANLARQPWFRHILIEADPYRFPQQHVQLIRDFGPDVNLANIAPGQVLRLEGLRRGIGRAVDYSIIGR